LGGRDAAGDEVAGAGAAASEAAQAAQVNPPKRTVEQLWSQVFATAEVIRGDQERGDRALTACLKAAWPSKVA
jgi:hypothetical protein